MAVLAVAADRGAVGRGVRVVGRQQSRRVDFKGEYRGGWQSGKLSGFLTLRGKPAKVDIACRVKMTIFDAPPGNFGRVIADGPPRDGMPASAAVTIPANGVIVLAK